MKEFNKNNPFKTPEGYFEGFADRLKDKLDLESSLPQEDGLAVPEGYFDEFHRNLQKKLDTAETKVVQLRPYRKYYIAAASVAAIFLVVFGLNWQSEEPSWDDLANADIESYFETNELGLTSYEIAEVIPVDELEINDILENQFNEENVIDYLNENIDDFEELNLEEYE